MSVNKVFLLGYVGKDPEIRTLDGGNRVASFSIATDEGYKDKSGNKVEKTEWHNISAFGGVVDVIEKYIKKGMQLHIEGKLKTSNFEKDGTKHYRTEVIMTDFSFVGKKDDAVF